MISGVGSVSCWRVRTAAVAEDDDGDGRCSGSVGFRMEGVNCALIESINCLLICALIEA